MRYILLAFLFCLNSLFAKDVQTIGFIENKGQIFNDNNIVANTVFFSAKISGVAYFFEKNQVTILTPSIKKDLQESNLTLPHANSRHIEGYHVSKFRWNTQNETFLPQGNVLALEKIRYYNENSGINGFECNVYEQIVYKNIQKGIDLIFYWKLLNNKPVLEYDLLVQPHARFKDIQFEYIGAFTLLNIENELALFQPQDTIVLTAPIAYQVTGSEKSLVRCSYQKTQKGWTFDIPTYDPTLPIIIDPMIIVQASYYGGSDWDIAQNIVADSTGFYIVGTTTSVNFPKQNAVFKDLNGNGNGPSSDAFILSCDAAGNRRWATYFGGANIEYGYAITLGKNNVTIGGQTQSNSMPVNNAFQATYAGGNGDAFLAQFNASGQYVWSTYLGGAGIDEIISLTTLPNGGVAAIGTTSSTDIYAFGSFEGYNNGGLDALCAEYSENGVPLRIGFMGGEGTDIGKSVAVNKNTSDILFAMNSSSNSLMTFHSLSDTFVGGEFDIYVRSVDTVGSIVFAGYLGGHERDEVASLCQLNNGDFAIAASSISNDFPLDNTNQGTFDAKIAILSPYGTHTNTLSLGGSEVDLVQSICTDSANGIIIGGLTRSNDLPIINEYQNNSGNSQDGFFARWDSLGNITNVSYYGGSNDDEIRGVCAQASKITCVGVTKSLNLPRIKMISNGLSTELEDVFFVSFNTDGITSAEPINKEFKFLIYPNPITQNNLTLQTNVKGNAYLSIFDSKGALLYSKDGKVQDDRVEYHISTDIHNGKYLVQTTAGGQIRYHWIEILR